MVRMLQKWFRRLVWLAVVLLLLAVTGGAMLKWVADAPIRAVRALQSMLQVEYSDQVNLFFRVNALSPHSHFVVASLEEMVTGAYISDKTLAGIDLGATSLEYRFPVTFLYAIDFSGDKPIDFRVTPETRTLVAIFPEVELLAVETDLGALEKELSVGWARMRAQSGREVQQRFSDNVMRDLRAKGKHHSNIYLVRETARRQLAGFVQDYLLHQQRFGEDGVEIIVVRFANEAIHAPLPVFRAQDLRDDDRVPRMPRDGLQIGHE